VIKPAKTQKLQTFIKKDTATERQAVPIPAAEYCKNAAYLNKINA